jgi:hypothetical protein
MWLSWLPALPSCKLGIEAVPFIRSMPDELCGNCWEKSMDGDDKEGMLGDASCSSWHGFKLLMIICCTRELWNSPRFISVASGERG